MPLFHYNVADTLARYDGLRFEAPSYCGDTSIDPPSERERERERERCVCVCVRAYIPVVPHKAVAEVSKIGDL